MPAAPAPLSVCFSHVHIYCDSIRTPAEYRRLEEKLNDFASQRACLGADVAAGREAWLGLRPKHGDPVARPCGPDQYSPMGQDIVEQLLVGLGWRVTGSHQGSSTRSLVVTSADPEGVKFVMTAHVEHRLDELAKDDHNPAQKRPRHLDEDALAHFDAINLQRFAKYHNGRQGVAVLGFAVSSGGVDAIRAKYAELHPKLLIPGNPNSYPGTRVLEVYAYYQGEKLVTDADKGTVLRFVEIVEDPLESYELWVLPGIHKIHAEFDGISQPAYCDHWVSNVFSRTGFLDTLNDTLGFTPKVDFNAGVVAAGEAQIESTVTGNTSDVIISDTSMALKDQSQVYLPINNALSEAGHVHVFLQELGQGIQHIASRVEDLAALIQRANDYRKMTGAGLSFLQIPRSYYGYVTARRLAQDTGLDEVGAEQCLAGLRKAGIVDSRDIVDLNATCEQVEAALPDWAPSGARGHVLRARYGNLYALLRDHISEETYLSIVRNNILVDIQGQDLLLQIFTSKVLQRSEGEESCFLEFIQRVCSECKDARTGCPQPIKPGCGGFGIRNFLTLFLSIEVSKAAAARAEAVTIGDTKTAEVEGKRVDAFTAQLDESNPILTAISDAMTAEGAALESGDSERAQYWAAEKTKGQDALQAVSSKYKELMRKLREEK